MTHPRTLCLTLTSLILLAAALSSPVASAQDVGSVAVAVGEVTGIPPGASVRALAVGDGFGLGTQIATGTNSESLLTFDPRGSLRLYAETRITVDQALVDQAGRSQSRLSVLLGRLRVAVGSLFSGELDIDTPTATVGIKGTELLVGVAEDGTTLVAVFEGAVSVTGKAGGEVTVTAGYRTVVRPGAPPLVPTPLDPRAGDREAAAGDPQLAIPADLYEDFPVFDDRGQELPFPPPPPGGPNGPTFNNTPPPTGGKPQPPP